VLLRSGRGNDGAMIQKLSAERDKKVSKKAKRVKPLQHAQETYFQIQYLDKNMDNHTKNMKTNSILETHQEDDVATQGILT
jgi:hypothetical protein